MAIRKQTKAVNGRESNSLGTLSKALPGSHLSEKLPGTFKKPITVFHRLCIFPDLRIKTTAGRSGGSALWYPLLGNQFFTRLVMPSISTSKYGAERK